MKSIKLEVTVNFDGHLYTDEEVKEVVENVFNAIDLQIDEVGISPSESDVMVTDFEVVEPFTQTTFKSKVI